MLTIADLQRLVASGEIDTVTLAFTDMQGRLVGKRVAAAHFVEDVADHGAECCSYLLAVDVEMSTVPGYPIAAWTTGYGDMVMRPDLTTLRRIPWLPGTAQVLADLYRADGSVIAVVPRRILAAQIARRAARGPAPTPPPSWNSSSSMPPTARRGPTATADPLRQPTTTRTTGWRPARAWSRCCETSADTWPPPECAARVSRANVTPDSRRSPSTTSRQWLPATTTPSARNLQERCQGGRRAARQAPRLQGEIR